MSQTKTEETKSDVAKNGMVVVACIDAMFNTHRHLWSITEKCCHRQQHLYSVMEKAVMEKMSWICAMETVRCAASCRRCRG